MAKLETYPLTYFTNRTKDELDVIIETLHSTLSKEEIAKLFIENFDAKALLENHTIAITDKLEWAIKHTLVHAIDTEILIRYIYSKFEEQSCRK